jgi:ABC-type nitrate/sulfonate/bicarbonate transport system substrate-binding protein
MADATVSPDTFWYTRCPVPTAFSIAVRQGWLDEELEDEGITFQSLAVSRDPSVRQSHFDQTQGNFFRHGGNIPPIVSRSRGRDVRLIGLSWTDYHEPVLALPGSGIETVADLRGRRLSLPRHANDSVDFWRATVIRGFGTALEVAGIRPDEVEWVDVVVDRTFVQGATDATGQRDSLWDARFMLGHQREEAAALLRGEVDAIFSQGSVATNVAAFTGARTVIDVGTLPERAQRVNNATPLALTVTGDLLDRRPDLVARVLARTLRAAEWAAANHEEAKRIVAAEVGLAEELVDAAYSPRLPDQLDVGLGPELVAGLASQVALLEEHGFLAGPVDLDAFIVREPLEEARRLLAADAVGASR